MFITFIYSVCGVRQITAKGSTPPNIRALNDLNPFSRDTRYSGITMSAGSALFQWTPTAPISISYWKHKRASGCISSFVSSCQPQLFINYLQCQFWRFVFGLLQKLSFKCFTPVSISFFVLISSNEDERFACRTWRKVMLLLLSDMPRVEEGSLN